MYHTPRIKFPFLRQHSSFSSNLQTESSSAISRNDIKNINILKKSMNSYTRKKNLTENNKNFSQIKISKLNLKNSNFLSIFLREKKSNAHKKNLLNLKLNKFVNNGKNKIKSRNEKRLSSNEKKYFTYEKKNEGNKKLYREGLKVIEPYYRYLTPRNKSFIDFNNDTRNLRYMKFNLLYGKKAIEQLKENISYNNAKTEMGEYSNLKANHLLEIFNKTLRSYMIYLQNIINEESLIEYNLSNQKKELITEIINIKNKINKLLFRFQTLLDMKFFLIDIKESTLDYKKLLKETKEEILYDLYKFYINEKIANDEFLYDSINKNISKENEKAQEFYNFLKTIKHNVENNLDSNRKFMFLNLVIISLDYNNFFNIFSNINYEKFSKLKNIFDSVEEFEKKLNETSSKNKLLLTNFNYLTIDIFTLKREVQKEIDKKKKELSIVNTIKNKIKLKQEKLNIISTNYNNNLEEYNTDKSKNKKIVNNIKILENKINIIINNIMSYNCPKIKNFYLRDKNSRDDGPITIFEKMYYLERVLIYLINYKNDQLINNLDNYNKANKDLKYEQIANKLKNREEIMKQIIQLKTKKINDKNNKIIFVSNRKVGDILYKKIKTKKNK